ncbi:hypothetical protein FS837_007576 [Tulasnella sp. UAMH 9824]|nr:hypothetical protein FS837_007576 [Tulasnella sp. UAMH 9824]
MAQMNNFCSASSHWDFYEMICRRTNNVHPETVLDLYSQFRRVICEWRYLHQVKRALYLDLEGIQAGGLVVPCPTCPKPGVNIPDDWKTDPLKRLKYASMLAVDGNFHLQRNHKGKPDYPLSGNRGFWADQGEFDDYIMAKQAKHDDDARRTATKCHSFKAGDPSRSSHKFRKSVQGVVMVSCGRHFVIMPNGTVDLDKGERFAYTDVALASVIRQQDKDQRHIHTYDIGCKYGIHFKERVTMSVEGPHEDEAAARRTSLPRDVLISPDDFPADFDIKVPSWHILGHIMDCVLRKNLRYMPMVGHPAGEGVETIWSIMNAHQYSTREMTHGNRRDVLPDAFNYYNWKKLTTECHRVSKAYTEACKIYQSKELDLKEIEKSIGTSKLQKLVSEAENRGNEQYGARVTKAPTKAKVLLELKKMEDERSANIHSGIQERSGEQRYSGALFLSNALEIEDLQYQLKTRNTEEFIIQGSSGADKRRAQHLRSLDALRRRIDEHLLVLLMIFPHLNEVSLDRSQAPTDQNLYLPSSFSDDQHKQYGMLELAEQEGRL